MFKKCNQVGGLRAKHLQLVKAGNLGEKFQKARTLQKLRKYHTFQHFDNAKSCEEKVNLIRITLK